MIDKNDNYSNDSLDKNKKIKRINYAILAGYIGEHIEDGFAQFLHDFTNTEYIKSDLTGGIIAAIVANVSAELMSGKLNVITGSIFATGLIYSIMAIYDNAVYGEEIDYDALVRYFIYDSIFIAIIMYFYKGLLEELKKHRRKYLNGPVYEVFKDVIKVLPISLYFGYRAFVSNLEESRKLAEENKNCEEKEEEMYKDVK